MIEVSIWYPVARVVGNDGLTEEAVSDKVRIEFVIPKHPFLFWDTYEAAVQIQYPRGYGVAYRLPEKAMLLFAPMPFNFLVGGLIWAWHWFRVGFAAWCWGHRPKRQDERKVGVLKVVDWVEDQRMAGETLIEGVGYGIAIPDEAWADFKKSEGVEQ